MVQFAPYSSSGGVWGDDGRLYVTGHDEQEQYVLALPGAGGRLIQVATIPIAARGRAVAWGGHDRTPWGIDRSTLELIEMRLPSIDAP